MLLITFLYYLRAQSVVRAKAHYAQYTSTTDKPRRRQPGLRFATLRTHFTATPSNFPFLSCNFVYVVSRTSVTWQEQYSVQTDMAAEGKKATLKIKTVSYAEVCTHYQGGERDGGSLRNKKTNQSPERTLLLFFQQMEQDKDICSPFLTLIMLSMQTD